MILTINNITAMLVPVIVTFYMLSYTRWLWQQNKKGGSFRCCPSSGGDFIFSWICLVFCP